MYLADWWCVGTAPLGTSMSIFAPLLAPKVKNAVNACFKVLLK